MHQRPSAASVADARARTGDIGRATAEPDYLLEGRVFDCYAPNPGKDVRGVWTVTKRKVESGQTQRVVLALHDWQGDLGALQQQFADWPVEGLKEVKLVTGDGRIIQVRPG